MFMPELDTLINFASFLIGWSGSLVSTKGARARDLLTWMIDRNQNGNSFIRPTFVSYTSVMSACVRNAKHLVTAEKVNNFSIVRQTFGDLARSDYLEPRSISYRIMISACRDLLPNEKEQQQQIVAIFQHCCRVGVVDEKTFSSFCDSANEHSKAAVGLDPTATWRGLPKEWTENCKRFNNIR